MGKGKDPDPFCKSIRASCQQKIVFIPFFTGRSCHISWGALHETVSGENIYLVLYVQKLDSAILFSICSQMFTCGIPIF